MEAIPEAEVLAPVQLPRITIRFCTQCKWMLRAAYFAQELLSTFSTSLGEVSLIPGTGGVFIVDIVWASDLGAINGQRPTTQTTRLWDRKAEGGFPEVKHLKQLVRNVIDPSRDLGHVDRDHKQKKSRSTSDEKSSSSSTGQLSTKKVPNDDQQTIATAPDAASARDPAFKEVGGQGERKDKSPAGGEACEDCK